MNSRRFVSLLLLGFSSGLPLYLTSKTLQAWMTTEKVDLTTIGLFALVSLPYSLKFLWAPLLDRFAPPWLGRRRGWILAFQILLGVSVLALSRLDPRTGLQAVAIAAVLIAFFSASQDVAFDAWRVEILPTAERGAGTATSVLGYRIALLATGSAALMLADHMPWGSVYALLAGLQLLLILGTWFAPEPERPVGAPTTLAQAVIEPFHAFFASRGPLVALATLAFIILFKWGVYLVSAMSTPFLLQIGFTQTDVGAVLGGAGLFATILGTAAGGLVMTKLPLRTALLSFGILQAVAALLFWGLALHGHNWGWMVSAVVAENFFIGMGTAALVAYIVGECDPRYAATQFALLSSLMAVGRDLLTSPSGAWAKQLGWPAFFLATLLASIPALLLLPLASRRRVLPPL